MDVLDVGSVIAGLILLCIGGYAIVSGGVALAKKLQISSMIIGLTVVAYGTSTPESDSYTHLTLPTKRIV